MSILKKLANNRSSDSLANLLRKKRFKHFCNLASSFATPIKILDVGGEPSFWQMMGFPDGWQITLLNLNLPTEIPSGFKAVVGDARKMPEFADKSFDIVFSNSVIEHVGGFADQQKMAEEVRRVGKSYFVQTPNYYFPIEPHFLFPGFQFLPKVVKCFLVQNFDLGWYQKIPDKQEAERFLTGFRLLTRRELKELFPQGKMIKESFYGLTKSWIVVGGDF